MLIDPRNCKQQGCNTLIPCRNSCGLTGGRGWGGEAAGRSCNLGISSPCLTFALHSGLAGRLGSGLFLRLFREEVPLAWGVCQASRHDSFSSGALGTPWPLKR